MAVSRTWHNSYTAHYHIVFPVKYRKALLTNDIPLAITAIARGISLHYDIEFEKIGCDETHNPFAHFISAEVRRFEPMETSLRNTMAEISKKLGNNIKRIRLHRKMSQGDIC